MQLKEVFLEIDNLETDEAPLFVLRPTGMAPVGAYVTLALDGEVRAQTDGEINTVDSVFERLVRWEVPPNVRGNSLVDMLESDECLGLLDRVHTGHSLVGKGEDRVGRFTREAAQARSRLMTMFLDWRKDHLVNCCAVGRFINPAENADFFAVWPPEMSLDEAIQFTHARAGRQNGLALVGDVKNALLAAARTAVVRGKHVRLIQRQALIEEGVIEACEFSIKPEDARCAAKGDCWIVKHAGALRFRVYAGGFDKDGGKHDETWNMQSKDGAIKSAEAWVRRNGIVRALQPQVEEAATA